MIRCLPRGVCSWDYVLRSEQQEAILTYDWMSEAGRITIGSEIFTVAKQGWLSGRWDLVASPKAGAAEAVLATGIKASALTRSFDVAIGSKSYLLQARSSWGRTFELLHKDGRLVSEMIPDHSFTRRASIKAFDHEIPFVIHAFTFWLVGLIWKRQQQSSAAS